MFRIAGARQSVSARRIVAPAAGHANGWHFALCAIPPADLAVLDLDLLHNRKQTNGNHSPGFAAPETVQERYRALWGTVRDVARDRMSELTI